MTKPDDPGERCQARGLLDRTTWGAAGESTTLSGGHCGVGKTVATRQRDTKATRPWAGRSFAAVNATSLVAGLAQTALGYRAWTGRCTGIRLAPRSSGQPQSHV